MTETLIRRLQNSPRRTPVTVWLQGQSCPAIPGARILPLGQGAWLIRGEWDEIGPHIQGLDCQVECACRNSALELMDIRGLNARVEPGAIIREGVSIGDRAVIMMGAILNVGARVGEDTMIDMGAVLGARAQVGKRCHIGAGAVLAGVLEPPSAEPVRVDDQVMIGANAVVLEGLHIGRGAVIAAGCTVISDVPENAVVAGVPGRIIKYKDEKTAAKTALVQALRQL